MLLTSTKREFSSAHKRSINWSSELEEIMCCVSMAVLNLLLSLCQVTGSRPQVAEFVLVGNLLVGKSSVRRIAFLQVL